jgi:hypothetical protein
MTLLGVGNIYKAGRMLYHKPGFHSRKCRITLRALANAIQVDTRMDNS